MKKWVNKPWYYLDYSTEKLPQAYLANEIEILSKEAQRKLKCLTWYYQHELNARKTCRHFGIHHSTFYEWLRNYDQDNLKRLEPKSRRPHKFRESKIPLQTQDLICRLRRAYPAWSKYKLAVILKKNHGIRLSASSIGRIIKRRGLINQQASRKRHRAALNPKLRAKGTKYKYPGSHVEIDTKHVYLFPGYRVIQFTAIDSVTKLRVLRMFSAPTAHNAAAFLQEVIKAFPFRIVNIQTDNGSEFKGAFTKHCQECRIRHCFSFPASPEQNALVERPHRTDDEDLYLQGNCGETLPEQRELLKKWEHTYNHVRPHQSLGYLTPAEYFAKIKRSKCR